MKVTKSKIEVKLNQNNLKYESQAIKESPNGIQEPIQKLTCTYLQENKTTSDHIKNIVTNSGRLSHAHLFKRKNTGLVELDQKMNLLNKQNNAKITKTLETENKSILINNLAKEQIPECQVINTKKKRISRLSSTELHDNTTEQTMFQSKLNSFSNSFINNIDIPSIDKPSFSMVVPNFMEDSLMNIEGTSEVYPPPYFLDDSLPISNLCHSKYQLIIKQLRPTTVT